MHPLPPLVSPKRVAKAIVRASRPHGPRAKVVGSTQGSLIAFNDLAPEMYKRTVRPAMRIMGMRRTDSPQRYGNVFEPGGATNSETGGWAKRRRRRFLLVSGGALALVAAARALRS
jgi:hypothetical protein